MVADTGLVEGEPWVGDTGEYCFIYSPSLPPSESHLFNKLESIALSPHPRTPVLGCYMSRALEHTSPESVCLVIYSGTPLLWTPWGPGEVSCMERCPLLGINLGTEQSVLNTEVSLFQGVSFKRGSTVF